MSDEERTHHRRAAVRTWREQTKSAYQYTAQVLRTERRAGTRFEVAAKLTGNFPGTLRHGLISELVIE